MPFVLVSPLLCLSVSFSMSFFVFLCIPYVFLCLSMSLFVGSVCLFLSQCFSLSTYEVWKTSIIFCHWTLSLSLSLCTFSILSLPPLSKMSKMLIRETFSFIIIPLPTSGFTHKKCFQLFSRRLLLMTSRFCTNEKQEMQSSNFQAKNLWFLNSSYAHTVYSQVNIYFISYDTS